MPFDKAEARLKTIKKLQAQLNEFKIGCYPRKEQKTYTIDAHSFDKAMKDLMRVTEENKKLREEVKEWKQACGEAEDNLDKEMKLNEDLQEGFEEMTHDEIMYSHEWVEWKEYREKCQRFIYRRNQQTNTKC
jgi:uncharacterized protein YigA (DUF484 family)